MAELGFSDDAEDQLRLIGEGRRRQAGSTSSRRLREAFDRVFTMLREFPRVGTVIHRVEDYAFRQFPVEGFGVRFVVSSSESVLIVDVRHGSMREPASDVLEQQLSEQRGDQS